jgi:hypothetical protein
MRAAFLTYTNLIGRANMSSCSISAFKLSLVRDKEPRLNKTHALQVNIPSRRYTFYMPNENINTDGQEHHMRDQGETWSVKLDGNGSNASGVAVPTTIINSESMLAL